MPRERLAVQPYVWNPFTGRLVAPWPRGTPLTDEEQAQLLGPGSRIRVKRGHKSTGHPKSPFATVSWHTTAR